MRVYMTGYRETRLPYAEGNEGSMDWFLELEPAIEYYIRTYKNHKDGYFTSVEVPDGLAKDEITEYLDAFAEAHYEEFRVTNARDAKTFRPPRRYLVTVQERWARTIPVEARSPEEAARLAKESEDEGKSFDYVETLSNVYVENEECTQSWDVET